MIPIRGLRDPAVPAELNPRRLPSRPVRHMTWTPALETQLRKLWTAGLPVSEIVAELDCGASRNAVIGKAHRLGLARRANPVGQANG